MVQGKSDWDAHEGDGGLLFTQSRKTVITTWSLAFPNGVAVGLP